MGSVTTRQSAHPCYDADRIDKHRRCSSAFAGSSYCIPRALINNNPPLALIDEPVVQRASSEHRNLNCLISGSELFGNWTASDLRNNRNNI
jgi:hypothetical protein